MEENLKKGWIDIHSHMLYGVDDGAKTLEETLEMIKIAYEQGTRGIVFTPHYQLKKNHYTEESLQTRFEEIQNLAKKTYPDLSLYLGNELLYEEGLAEALNEKKARTINNTKYILVEFLPQISYNSLYRVLKELAQLRFRPILAHLERYQCLFKNQERILELMEMDIYLQMNAESILGNRFNAQVRWCRKLLKERRITFMGSDAHNCTNRPPGLADAVTWLQKNLPVDYVENLLIHYPQTMLNDEYPR